MWFLWFYLISVAICVVILLIMGIAAKNRLKRENAIRKTTKKSFAELFCAFMPYLIPFVNLILIVCAMLQSNKLINETIKKYKDNNGEQ